MDDLWSELDALKRDRTREQRIAATWQVTAHHLLNKKTFGVLFHLGPRVCWRYLRLNYYVELAAAGMNDEDSFEYEPQLFEDHAFAETIDQTRPTTCLVSKSGAALPFCSIEHMHSFTKSLTEGLHSYRLGQTSSKIKYCSHCCMCGSIIRRPAPGLCMIHEKQCPAVDVHSTLFSGDLIQN